jgi:hypothetical protein
MYFNIAYECYKALLDPQGQSSYPDVSMHFDGPWRSIHSATP